MGALRFLEYVFDMCMVLKQLTAVSFVLSLDSMWLDVDSSPLFL